MPLLDRIKSLYYGYRAVAGSSGPFSRWDDRLGGWRRIELGAIKTADLMLVPFAPAGVSLRLIRNQRLGLARGKFPPAGETAALFCRQPRTPDTMLFDLDGTLTLDRAHLGLIELLLHSETRIAFISHRSAQYIRQNIIDKLSPFIRDNYHRMVSVYEAGGGIKHFLFPGGELREVKAYQVPRLSRDDYEKITRCILDLGGRYTTATRSTPDQRQIFIDTADIPASLAICLYLKARLGEDFEVVYFKDVNQVVVSRFSKRTAAEDAVSRFGSRSALYLGDRFDLHGNDSSVAGLDRITCVNVGEPCGDPRVLESSVRALNWMEFVIFLKTR